MAWLNDINYIGQKVNIIKEELQGKTGILKKVINFYLKFKTEDLPLYRWKMNVLHR